MKNKKIIIAGLIAVTGLFSPLYAFSLFNIAAGDFSVYDTPLVDGILYFVSGAGTFVEIASVLALTLGIIGITFCCFKLWFGTYDCRKAVVDMFCKWILYTLATVFYPLIVSNCLTFAMNIGATSCGGIGKVFNSFIEVYQTANTEYTLVINHLSDILSGGYAAGITDTDLAKLKKELGDDSSNNEIISNLLTKLDIPVLAVEDTASSANAAAYDKASSSSSVSSLDILFTRDPGKKKFLKDMRARQKSRRRQLRKGVFILDDGKKITAGEFRKDIARMEALKSLFCPDADPDPITGKVSETNAANAAKGNPTPADFFNHLFISVKGDTKGNTESILSPSAIIKVSILIAQIMDDTNAENIVTAYKDSSSSSSGSNSSSGNNSNSHDSEPGPLKKWSEWVWQNIVAFCMNLLMTIMLISSAIFFSIQYIMTILEYFICTSVGYIFIPCILFDGTKSYATKLVNLFVSYFLKIMVMCMCIFWVFSAYLDMANDLMLSMNSSGFTVFAQVCYTCILGLIVTQNGPQIASALMSGNPSLSMGEFINSAKSFGTGAVAGALASYGANQARKVAGGAKNLHAAGKAAGGAAQKFNNGAANFGQTLSTAGGIASAGKENGGGAGKASSFLKDSFNGAFGNHVQSKLTGQKSGESGKLSHQSTGGKGGWARDKDGNIEEENGKRTWDPNYNRAQNNHGVNGTQTSADIRQHQQEMREHAMYGDTMNVPKAPESGGSKQNTPLSDEGAVSNREKTGRADDPER